jgi:uncharacterized membrane protein YkvA (DUF1232 family)
MKGRFEKVRTLLRRDPDGPAPAEPVVASAAPNAEAEPDIARRAKALFERRFLREAAAADVEEQLDGQLGKKLSSLGGKRGATMTSLRALTDQASELWSRRGSLQKQHVLYLAAALLYFIAPLDVVPDVIPALGYADDVVILSGTVGMILKALPKVASLGKAKDALIDDLLEKGKLKLNEVIDEREDALFERLDHAATDTIRRTVTSISISLWATTTAAAVSIAISTLAGTYPPAWLTYVVASSAIVLIWNVVTALNCLRGFRELDGRWQERLPELVAARIGLRHAVALALPVLVLIGLGVARVLLRT